MTMSSMGLQLKSGKPVLECPTRKKSSSVQSALIPGLYTITKKADEREVPDWKKFFADEIRGRNIREIFRNTRGFAAPATHYGKVMSKEEADFVLFQTYSIVKYVISGFEDKSPRDRS